MNSMNKGLFRKKKVYFTQVSNKAIRNSSLSLRARGLYTLIQSYITIEDFVVYKTFLRKQCPEGERAFESAWKELKETGYLIQYKLKDEKGAFYYEYELLDEPGELEDGKSNVYPHPQNVGVDNEKPHLHFADMDSADMDNAGVQNVGCINNTNKTNTINNNTIENKKDSVTVPQSDSIQLIGKFQNLILDDISEVSFNTWIKPLEIRIGKSKAEIVAPNNFSRKIIKEKYLKLIREKFKLLNISKIELKQ